MCRFIKIVLSLCVLSGFQLFAANDDVFACCSTTGPDRYADGSIVADGETYALVYTKSGSKFSGFQADGTLVDPVASELVMSLPRAREGRCQPTLCVLSKTYSNRRRTGTWELILLDTRRADGKPAGLDDAGTLHRVNSWGHTESFVDFTQSAFSLQSVSPSSASLQTLETVASNRSVLPAGTPAPRVTGISVEGDTVSLTVADTRPYLTYGVKGGERLDAGLVEAVAKERQDGDGEQEIVIRADGQKARFFRVVTDW